MYGRDGLKRNVLIERLFDGTVTGHSGAVRIIAAADQLFEPFSKTMPFRGYKQFTDNFNGQT